MQRSQHNSLLSIYILVAVIFIVMLYLAACMMMIIFLDLHVEGVSVVGWLGPFHSNLHFQESQSSLNTMSLYTWSLYDQVYTTSESSKSFFIY